MWIWIDPQRSLEAPNLDGSGHFFFHLLVFLIAYKRLWLMQMYLIFCLLFCFVFHLFFFFFEEENILKFHWMEIESKYNASTAGGGESSIQTTSLNTSLACLGQANEWATVLALRLSYCTCDHRSPLSKQTTSWSMCPNRDEKPFFNLRAVMTDWLSPSITSFVKPHPTTNSTARQQASISASSLQVTDGPFAYK